MDIVAKLRYQGRQYAAGQEARAGGQKKHYLEEAADEIESLRSSLSAALNDRDVLLARSEELRSQLYAKKGAKNGMATD